MACKLTAAEIAERDHHVAKLRELADAIDGAVTDANVAVAALLQPVTDAIAAYNTYLADVSSFAAGVADRLTAEVDAKSDAWRESEKGSVAETLASEWEGVSLDDCDELEDVEVAVDVPDHADTLADLPIDTE